MIGEKGSVEKRGVDCDRGGGMCEERGVGCRRGEERWVEEKVRRWQQGRREVGGRKGA